MITPHPMISAIETGGNCEVRLTNGRNNRPLLQERNLRHPLYAIHHWATGVALAILGLGTSGLQATPLLTIDTVEVGNAGNAAANSTNAFSWGTNYGYGAVGYDFQIGTYSVTNQQYTTFLNAVDPGGANTLGLWNSSMNSSSRGGISFNSAASAGSKYSVKANFGNKPVNYVSFYDAAHFTNWLNNGATTSSSTMNGAYSMSAGAVTEASRSSNVATLTSAGHTLSVGDQMSLSGIVGYFGTHIITAVTANTFSFAQTGSDQGATPVDGTFRGVSATREAGATWWLPSEDEWVKAAYYDPSTETYSLYATQSNGVPTVATSDSAGNITNPGSNVANYSQGVDWNSADGNVSTVGSAGATSFYGAYDLNGNVSDWNEAFVNGDSSRGLHSGSWSSSETILRASQRGWNSADNESWGVGFRVASVPEPSSALLILLGGAALLSHRRFRRKL
jgi:formylglycine-generating enzyme required for sulfatase activity